MTRKDASGAEDVCIEDFNQDNNPLNDLGRSPSGGTSGSSLIRAFSAALAGAAVLASANKKEASNTKILADVKVKKQDEKESFISWHMLINGVCLSKSERK